MIINQSTNRTISDKEIICNSILSQARGLMFRKRQNLVMVFPKERKIQLHNFFVFYPLDLIILDKEMQVVEIKKNFRPFTFWTSKDRGKYLIELGNYMINNSIKVGDIIKFS